MGLAQHKLAHWMQAFARELRPEASGGALSLLVYGPSGPYDFCASTIGY